MRINKYLASCGFGSRRGCEEIISNGRVKVNGRVVKELGTDITERDTVTVDDKPVSAVEEFVYLMFNKPKGCVTTLRDDKGRKTVFDYINCDAKHLFPVGRLDYDTEGLLLVTNDGDFANRLTHPSVGIEKTYVAVVEGAVSPEQVNRLRSGIMLDESRTKPAKVHVLAMDEKESRVEMIISEGRNRQVRRMLEAVGLTVKFLKRTQIGALKLGGLGRGQNRPLTEKEIGYFIIKNSAAKTTK